MSVQAHMRPWPPFVGRIKRIVYSFDGKTLKLVFLNNNYDR